MLFSHVTPIATLPPSRLLLVAACPNSLGQKIDALTLCILTYCDAHCCALSINQMTTLERTGQIHVHSLPAAAGAVVNADPRPAHEAGQSANAAQGLDANPTLTLPPPGAPVDVACAALSAHFLVAGTATGGLWYFRCAERAPVAEARHAQGVRRVWPQPAGVRHADAVCRKLICLCDC